MARHSKARSEAFLPARADRPRSRGSGSAARNPDVEALWAAIAAIPRGQASTYGGVARDAGLPGRARLAGFALQVAPADMHLPWHRVVAAGGRIAFPRSSRAYREQARLLRAEGIIVTNGRVAKGFIRVFFDG